MDRLETKLENIEGLLREMVALQRGQPLSANAPPPQWSQSLNDPRTPRPQVNLDNKAEVMESSLPVRNDPLTHIVAHETRSDNSHVDEDRDEETDNGIGKYQFGSCPQR